MSDALLNVYDRDLVLVKGKGAKLIDREGRTWLDFAAGIAVNGFVRPRGNPVRQGDSVHPVFAEPRAVF